MKGVGMANASKAEIAKRHEYTEYVRAWFAEPPTSPDDARERFNYFTVYTVVKHVSASGLTRWIAMYVVRDGRPVRIAYRAATAMGWTYSDDYEAVKVEGVGMDMGFKLVYELSYVLFANDATDRPGYVLNHQWL